MHWPCVEVVGLKTPIVRQARPAACGRGHGEACWSSSPLGLAPACRLGRVYTCENNLRVARDIMRRYWLVFSQAVTVLLAAYFVVATLKPEWLGRHAVSAVSRRRARRGARRDGIGSAARGQFPAGGPEGLRRRGEHQHQQGAPSAIHRPTIPGSGSSSATRARQPQAGLGSGVIISARRLHPHQQPRGRGRRRDRGRPQRQPQGARQGDRHRPRHRPGHPQDHRWTGCRSSRWATPTRCRWATRCWRSATPSASARPSPAASSARWGATSWASTPSRTSSRPTPPSTRATRAARWSTSTANLMGINTAIYSRSGGSMGIGFAIPVSTAKLVLEGIVKDGVVRRGWIGVEPADLSPELMETFGVKAKRGRADHRRAAERAGGTGRHPSGRRDRGGGGQADRQRVRAAFERRRAQARQPLRNSGSCAARSRWS